MFIQFNLTSHNYTNYPCELRGKYHAKLVHIIYKDNLGSGQHRLIRLSSTGINNLTGSYSKSILFCNTPEHSQPYDSHATFIIEANGTIDFTMESVAGGALGTLQFACLTLEIEQLQD